MAQCEIAPGAVIPGATVTIVEQGGNSAPRIIQTDAHGNYTVTNLPAGNYTITVSANGFQTYKAQNVTLFVAQTRTVDAQLHLGQVSQTVTVQENAETVDTTTSSVEGTISGTQVRELQLNNRNFEQLVTLQPGVVSGLPDEVGFGLSNTSDVAVNGVRATANNWTVDGADINDSGSNATLLNVPSVDAIQEFTLERSTYDAGFRTQRRRPDSCRYEIGNQPIPWRCIRVRPQHRFQRQQLLQQADQPCLRRERSSTTTTTDSPSADPFTFPRLITRRKTGSSSSGQRSGAR